MGVGSSNRKNQWQVGGSWYRAAEPGLPASVPSVCGSSSKKSSSTSELTLVMNQYFAARNKLKKTQVYSLHAEPSPHPAQARILVHGKVTHLGYYETEEEAARVYDK